MSLIVVPFESLGAVSYSPSMVTVAVSVAVCEIFSVKEWRDLENQVIIIINVKKLQFIHKLTASDTSKTAKITKR